MFPLLNLKSLLIGALLILLLVSIVVQALTTYWLMSSEKFTWDSTTPALSTKKGVEAAAFWEGKKIYVLTPTILNIMGALLVVTLVYVA